MKNPFSKEDFRFREWLETEKGRGALAIAGVTMAFGLVCLTYEPSPAVSPEEQRAKYESLARENEAVHPVVQPKALEVPPKMAHSQPKEENAQRIDIAKAYPFVHAADGAGANPAPMAGQSLPMPVVPGVPQPGFSLPPVQAPQEMKRDVFVRGVFIGKVNVAILSDGSLVEVGGTHKQSRVAAIDRNGVTLEDGQIIPYGINP